MDTHEEKLGPPEQEISKSKRSYKRSAAQRWVRILKMYFGVFFVVCAFGCIFFYHELQWPKPDGDFDTWDFDKQGAKGITVPFTSPDGLIHIQGYIGNRPVQFTVDTGASSSIIPKRLHLGTQYADDSSTMHDALGNTVWTRPVFLSDVRIGGIAIRHFSGIVPEYDLQHHPISSGATVTDLTLGNSALSHVVVTIDYSKNAITFQPPQQQALPLLTKPLTCMRFSWPKGDTALHNRAPFISGETNHHPLNIVLDTGTVAALVIPASLKDTLLKSKNVSLTGRKMKTNTLFGLGPEAQTTPMTISLHPDSSIEEDTITSNAQVATGWSDPTCILWGEDSLSAYIVTIDYPHRTVTLAPDPGTELAPTVSHASVTPHRKAH